VHNYSLHLLCLKLIVQDEIISNIFHDEFHLKSIIQNLLFQSYFFTNNRWFKINKNSSRDISTSTYKSRTGYFSIENHHPKPVSLKNVLNDVSLESIEENRSTNYTKISYKPATDSKKNKNNNQTQLLRNYPIIILLLIIWLLSRSLLNVPSGSIPCSRQYNSQQALPICTPKIFDKIFQ
jgi:hypothetical protein